MTDGTRQTSGRKRRQQVTGVVTSAHKTPKTIHVEVQYMSRHPKYGKYLRRSLKLYAHDEKQEARLGDWVQLMACRPLSKTKNWRLVKVVTSTTAPA